MVLEDFIEKKKGECVKLIRGCFPDWTKEGEVDRWAMKGQRHYDEIEAVGKEFLVWDNLSKELYWRSWEYVNSLMRTEGEEYFSEEDKKNLVEIMVEQIIEGKMVASKVPLYSDVWKMVGAEDGLLESFVTDECLDMVINSGFWRLMEVAGAGDKFEQDAAGQELTKFFNYSRLFNFLDFEEGVERAKHLPSVLNLGGFGNWYSYMAWYMIQEAEIYRQLEGEERNEVLGKLVAPLVGFLIDQASREYEHSEILKNLINLYITPEIIKTEPMQVMLGRMFEKQLDLAFTCSEYYYSGALKICEKALIETDGLAAKVWNEVKDEGMIRDFKDIPETARKYVPASYYGDKIKELRGEIGGMKRFDKVLFEKWTNLRPGKEVTEAMRNKVRNEIYQVYFTQKRRPGKQDLLYLRLRVEGGLTDKINAFLFADFVLRKEWEKANDILIRYRELQPYKGRNFMKGLQEYVEEHGLIKVEGEGLQARTCLPEYNFLPSFKKASNNLFES